MEFQPQQQFGNYRILRCLGKGGMGAVYEVEHIRLGAHFALKAFTLDHGDSKLLRERFLAEGKVLAQLRHAGLVRVYDLDFDAATGTPYFVMDLVLYQDGEPRTLADIDEGGVDEETLVGWFRELLDALNYVHAAGIVHRDVKLNNILLAADRRVVLCDFGVARFFGEEVRNRIQVESTMQMTNGRRIIMGTPHYLPPEVDQGAELTPAADLYALGAVFYHLLTGMWYEPGETARGLLDGFEYDWRSALLPLLDDDPSRRVAKVPERRSQEATSSAVVVPVTKGKGSGSRAKYWLVALAAIVVATGLLVLVWKSFGSQRKIEAPKPTAEAEADWSFDKVFAIPEGMK